jgi:hypothetical protein
MPHDARNVAASSAHVAPPPTLGISSHLQSISSQKQRLEKFSHSSTFSKFHAGAASATVIQRVWRSHISRLIQSDMRHLQRLVALERSILTVQRCWRGHLGRSDACGRASECLESMPPRPHPTLTLPPACCLILDTHPTLTLTPRVLFDTGHPPNPNPNAPRAV